MERSSASLDSLPVRCYRDLVTAFPNGVLVLFDEELRYRVVGPDVLPFSKREASEMVGKTIWELFGDEAGAVLEPELRATLAGEARSFDMTFEDRVHHLETRPVKIDGDAFGVLVTQEVTAERERKAALEDKTQRLETVANVLSHDLRNPFNVAVGHLDTLEDEIDSDHPSIDAIRNALRRMDTIMADAHVLARDVTALDREPVDLESHVRAAWQLVATEDATLSVTGTCIVDADAGLFANLLENLVRNAVSHGGDAVTVTAGPLRGGNGFYVEDDGPGVDPDLADSVFEPGFSTGTSEEHSGLGLAIVAEIADAHDWTVTLTTADSGGARFEVSGIESTA